MESTTIEELKVSDLQPYPGNPFGIRGDEEMKQLHESVSESGILNPLIVRPFGSGYQILSGHRRYEAAMSLGLETVPAIVRDVSNDEAVILLVDSNLHRQELLPSEKAFAYKMKLDVMKHQGKATCAQLGHKSRDILAEDAGTSRETIRRYIRLTYLAKPILDKVDEKQIALTPAVELSYLTPDEQEIVLDAMDYYECTPSYSQTVRLHRLSEQGELDGETIYDILGEEKANQRERISLEAETVRRFFPSYYTEKEIGEAIVKLLEREKRRNSRDER